MSISVVLGKRTIVLKDSDHLATGGEGSVYRNGNMVVKVYTATNKDFTWLEEKVSLLSPLASKDRRIIAPIEVVYNKTGKVIGYAMPFTTGETLLTAFTNAWWQQNNFRFSDAEKVVLGMREIVEAAHSGGALLVDGNENNYILSGTTPSVIDVDSWQIGKFKATAIMPSIRDPHSSTFTDNTDWYAWGVVTFQLWTSLHPYKGRHPKFKLGDMQGRMRANASVFDKEATYHTSVRDFSNIPKGLLDWYISEFQLGERSPPPPSANFAGKLAYTGTPLTTRKVTSGPDNTSVKSNKVFDGPTPVIRTLPGGIVITQGGVYKLKSSKHEQLFSFTSPAADYTVVSLVDKGLVLVFLPLTQTGGKMQCIILDYAGKKVSRTTEVEAQSHFACRNRVFAVQERGVAELAFFDLAIAGVDKLWPVLTGSFKKDLFSGCGAFSVPGGGVFSFIPQSKGGCLIIPLPQLSQKVLANLWGEDKFFACTTLEKDGSYMKHEFFLDDIGSVAKYWQSTTDSSELNIAVTSKGIVVTVPDDDVLVLFSNTSSSVRKVNSQQFKTGRRLFFVDNSMFYVDGNSLWDISLS